MLNVPLRKLVLVLAVTDHVTVPLPVPLAGVQVSQMGALLDGVHGQVVALADTVNVPLLAAAPGLELDGESPKVQLGVAPACVTENVCPAIVSVP